MPDPNLLTLAQAAERLDRNAATLRQQAIRGVLKAERIDTARGPVWMVSEEEIERYEREHRRSTSTPTRPRAQRRR